MKKLLKGFNLILSFLAIIILFINIVLIVKAILYPDKVPSFLGYKPYIVLSSSTQTDVNLGDFILAKKVENLEKNDIVMVKTNGKNATTYSINDINKNMLKLENDTGDYVNLSKESIEGKVVVDVKILGEIYLMLQNPIIIVCICILVIIIGCCIYRIKILN